MGFCQKSEMWSKVGESEEEQQSKVGARGLHVVRRMTPASSCPPREVMAHEIADWVVCTSHPPTDLPAHGPARSHW